MVDSGAMPESPVSPAFSAEPAPNTIVHCVAYADGRKVGEIPIDGIRDALQVENQFVWIGLYEPSEALLRRIQQVFGLHDLAVEDAFRAHQRPKLEEYGEGLFVVLRTVPGQADDLDFGETHVFVGRRYVVSVRHRSLIPYVDVRARCESTPHLLRKGPGFVLYALMDYVVDRYFPLVDDVEERLEALEEEIFSGNSTRQTTERIYNLKRELMALRRAISPLVEVCHRLVRFDIATIPEDTQVYFRDVYDHVIRINETVDSLRELLSAALEAHLSLISVGQNDVMKKLAAWAAILAVPTLIAGVYGMNFRFMPELDWHFGYPMVMGTTALLCGALYYQFKRIDWL